MAFKRITENDMLGKGNVGKPDTPGVSTSEMQRIMDELPREVIAPAFNELSGQLEADTASADIGANAPDGITPDPAPAENSPAKLQSVLQGIVNKITDHIADHVKHVASEERTSWNNASNDRHTHDNKSILDGITSSLVGNWNAAFAHVSDAVRHITENERTNWNDKYTKSETDKAINERVVEIGSSDMTKAVYDPETRNLPYIPKIDAEALTLGKNVVLSGTPVSIAYAGAQRIASITAYGETPQGGTTEAPMALTGVDSVQVCGRNLLPMATSSQTLNGITCTSNSDGSVTIKGTATGWSTMVIDGDFSLPAGTYTLNSNTQTTGVGLSISKDVGGTQNIATSSTTSKTFTLPDLIKHYVAYIVVRPNSVVDTTIYPMLNLGSTAMPYEPYQGSVTTLPIPRPLRRVGDVKDKCVTRVKSECDKKIVFDGSADEDWSKIVVSGIGTIWRINQSDAFYRQTPLSNIYPSVAYVTFRREGVIYIQSVKEVNVIDILDSSIDTIENWRAKLSSTPLTVYYKSTAYDGTNGLDVCMTEYQTGYIESYAGESITTAWISSTGALSTGAEVAYVLASAETYATDPVDFDNAAGPLTVMTGGEVVVRMTELVGNREFTERLSYIGNPNLLDNSNFNYPINQRDGTSYSTSTGNAAYSIDRWRIEGATYTVATHTLSGTSYTNRACRMAQFIEMAQYGLNIGDDMSFSMTVNGTEHSATAKILNRDQYSSFENVPSAYSCDDFDIVLCTGLDRPSIIGFTICPKKALVLEWLKLEKGSVATPYVHKSYGAELAACQRYFYYLDVSKWYACYQITGWGLIIPIDVPVPMRAQPTIDATGAKVFTPGGWINATSASVNQYNKDKARINITLQMPADSMTSYEGKSLVATGLYALSAEL